MIPFIWFTYLTIIIFSLGIVNILIKRDGINLVVGVELIVNAALINFISGSAYILNNNGAVYGLLVLITAVLETVMLLVLLLVYFDHYGSLDFSRIRNLRG